MDQVDKMLCKLCLQDIIVTNFQVVGEVILKALAFLSLNMSLDENENYMCNDCSEKLFAAFDFKMTCLDTEDNLLPHIDSEKAWQVDLRDAYLKVKGGDNTTITLNQQVCRLCMRIVDNGFTSLEELRDVNMVDKYIPEVNFSITKDPVVCKQCWNSLNVHIDFLRKWMDVEKKIKIEAQDPDYYLFVKSEETDVKFEEHNRDTCLHESKENKLNHEIVDETCVVKQEIENSTSTNATTFQTSDFQGVQENCLAYDPEDTKLQDMDCSEVSMYKCDTCHFETKYKYILNLHLAKHKDPSEVAMDTRDELDSLQEDKITPKVSLEKQKYKCEKCKYETKWKHNLKKHQITHGRSSEVQMYKCNECNDQAERADKDHQMEHDLQNKRGCDCQKMPRRKKAKQKPVADIPPEKMRTAIRRMEEGVKLRAVCQEFDIPVTTLWRYWKKAKGKTEEEKKLLVSPNFRVKTVFCEEQEQELRDHLIFASRIHHGLTGQEARLLAFELAQKKKLRIPSSWARLKIAGPDWLKAFRKRWPELTIRNPKVKRCATSNGTTVKEFFNNVANAFEQISDLHGGRIYNLHDITLTKMHSAPIVSSRKGLRVGRGALITACCFVNAAGSTVPPLLIFPRVNFKSYVLSGGPNGTSLEALKSDWLSSEIFVKILQHFQKHTNCSMENPVVLLMNRPEVHIKIEAIDFCRSNGIHVIAFPPHSTKKLQPFVMTVYKSLKANYDSACNNWMASNPGKAVTKYDVASLFSEAYPKAVRREDIISGFRCTGLWPLNCNVFTEDDFFSS